MYGGKVRGGRGGGGGSGGGGSREWTDLSGQSTQ